MISDDAICHREISMISDGAICHRGISMISDGAICHREIKRRIPNLTSVRWSFNLAIYVLSCLTIPYHVFPYHMISYHVLPFLIMSHYTVLCLTIPSYYVFPYHSISHLKTSYHTFLVLPRLTMHHHVLKYHTMSYYT